MRDRNGPREVMSRVAGVEASCVRREGCGLLRCLTTQPMCPKATKATKAIERLKRTDS